MARVFKTRQAPGSFRWGRSSRDAPVGTALGKAGWRHARLLFCSDPHQLDQPIASLTRYFGSTGLRRLISCKASSPPLSYSSLNR